MHRDGEEIKNAVKIIKISFTSFIVKLLSGLPKVAWGCTEHSLNALGIVIRLHAGRPTNLHSISDSAKSVISLSVQTGSGAHPVFCLMILGGGGGVNPPGRQTDRSHSCDIDVKNEWGYTSTSPRPI
jgi:hypothetical protein